MTQWRFERYRDAYLNMAKFYRIAAPRVVFGPVLLSKEELADPARLHEEATKYGLQFLKRDDDMDYNSMLGCPDGRGNQAFVYVLEAARCICGVHPRVAIKLLRMAIRALEKEYKAKLTEEDHWLISKDGRPMYDAQAALEPPVEEELEEELADDGDVEGVDVASFRSVIYQQSKRGTPR